MRRSISCFRRYPIPSLHCITAARRCFRSMGNSKISMLTSFVMNGLNIVGNAILIYGAGMAVAGAATATLGSWILGAVYMLWLLEHPDNPLSIRGMLKFRPSVEDDPPDFADRYSKWY